MSNFICEISSIPQEIALIGSLDKSILYALQNWSKTRLILQSSTIPAHLQHSISGETTILPRREADILQRLCQHQGEIVPTQNILLDLWGDDDFFNARSLQVLITRLRGHLSRDPRIRIINVRGTGYKLIVE